MADDFKKEFICTLHTYHGCSYQHSYSRECSLKADHKYVTETCPYRLEAVLLAAAEKEESPVSSPNK
jgi:hypothetical protein